MENEKKGPATSKDVEILDLKNACCVPEPAFLKRVKEIVSKDLGTVMDARRDLHRVEESLRDLWYEIGQRAVPWACCTKMDLEIKLLPGYDTSNGDNFNEYKCKNCGTKWVKRVGNSIGMEVDSEIEDYHRGLVSQKKLRCPFCHSAHLHINIINHDKRTHEYEVWCSKCDWKQRSPFSFGFLEGETDGETGDGSTKEGQGSKGEGLKLEGSGISPANPVP